MKRLWWRRAVMHKPCRSMVLSPQSSASSRGLRSASVCSIRANAGSSLIMKWVTPCHHGVAGKPTRSRKCRLFQEGWALDYTMQMPTEDRYLMTRTELMNRITVLLGGRAAEMAAFGEATTGAADDLQRATEMARAMVARYGMEPTLGQASFAAERPRYLDLPGLSPMQSEAHDETNTKIDAAIRKLVDEAFDRATSLLQACAAVHRESAQRLLEKETFSEEDLAPIRTAVLDRVGRPLTATAGPAARIVAGAHQPDS